MTMIFIALVFFWLMVIAAFISIILSKWFALFLAVCGVALSIHCIWQEIHSIAVY